MAESNPQPSSEEVAYIDMLSDRYVFMCAGLPAYIAASGAIEALHRIAASCPKDFRVETARAMRAMADHLDVCEGKGEAPETPLMSPEGPPPGTPLC